MHEDMLYEGIGGKTHKSEPRAMVELNHADGKLVIEAKCQSMPQKFSLSSKSCGRGGRMGMGRDNSEGEGRRNIRNL